MIIIHRRNVFNWLMLKGYYVELLREPWTCFDSRNYRAVLVVDPEETFAVKEIEKLVRDIRSLYHSNLIIHSPSLSISLSLSLPLSLPLSLSPSLSLFSPSLSLSLSLPPSLSLPLSLFLPLSLSLSSSLYAFLFSTSPSICLSICECVYVSVLPL